ncbi:putative bifunctional diguanylate cyclase/phosphodiesterase [uncultured Enterovirga sp.]|uniref:putative bifunctional diguanylate cyclase/phosphodiesterase n=1 Tax=uncultured Enterovirga sp. TaxID=2026352 RepID=UPI0035C95724
MLGRPPSDAIANPQAYRVLIDSLFSSPTTLVIGTIVGTLAPLFCWYASENEMFKWYTLAAAIVAVFRLSTLLRYRMARSGGFSISALWSWDREYFVGATLFSLLIGTVSFAALAFTHNVPSHIMMIGIVISFSSGYVARNAGRPRFVIVQLICFCAPMAAGLLVSSDRFYSVIALYIVLFILTNISIVFSLNRNLLQLAAAMRRSERLAASLQHKNLTLDSALNSMTHGLCLFGPDLKLEVSNTRFLELYGLSADDVPVGVGVDEIGASLVHAQTLTPYSVADLKDLCRRAAESSQSGEREMLSESGRTYVVTVEITGDGGILMLTEDVSARKAAAAQIERMAHCDTLTGLPNRFRFGEVLKASLKAGVNTDGKLALFYVDLDDFKVVNDSQGHEAGDHLLIKLAERLLVVIPEGGLVGRFGGDEFLVLVNVADESIALTLAQRVIADLAEPIDLQGKMVSVTASIGIALAPEHGAEPSELMRSADMALYSAKAGGRNMAILYTPAIADALSHRRELETDLREATRTGRLFLNYQPIVDARTNQVRSYEALMRWHHPEKGPISPVDFIPIAEQTGLIVGMGAWALRQACADATTWPDKISVAVNVSAFQFKTPSKLIDAVKDALLISGLSPERLELEVTESLLIADQERTLEAIRTLRRLGVRFSLDDFGTGYSSLAYLARYPFSKVKIDRTFAEHLTSDSPSRAIIEVVCQLAQKFGMRVVVEGIETEAQRRVIVALGVEQAQGWLFGRPQTLEAMTEARSRDAA